MAGQVQLTREAEGGEDELRTEEEEKRVPVVVVQEAKDLEEEQQREERVQVLHTRQVNMTEIREVSDCNP